MKSEIRRRRIISALEVGFGGGGGSPVVPTTQITNILITANNDGSANIAWTNGDGDGTNRLIVMRSIVSVDANPSNGVMYTANTVYGSGSEIGTGNFVVHKGAGTSVTVTGLTIGVLYEVRGYEANGTTYLTSTASNNPKTFTEEASPLGDSGLQLWVDFTNTKTAWQQEDNAPAAVDYADADTEPVGQIYDTSPNVFIMGSASSTRRPLLGSGGGRNSFVTWDNTPDDSYRIQNSTNKFNFIHATNPVYSIALWIKMGTDGTLEYFLGNNNNTTSQFGFRMVRFTSNVCTLEVSYGAGGVNRMINFGTVFTLTVADGWKLIVATVNGTGAATGTYYKADAGSIIATETFAVGATGSTSDASNNLFFGSSVTPGNYLNSASVACYGIWNRVLSVAEIDILRAWNPERRSIPFLRVHSFYDLNDITTIYSDAGVTQITDEGLIHRIKSKEGTVGRYLEFVDPTSTLTGVKPVWKQAEVNGMSVGQWTYLQGVSFTNLAIIPKLERGGSRLELLIAKLEAPAGIAEEDRAGSHYFSSGPGYPTETDPSYQANIPLGQPNMIVHAGNVAAAANIVNFPYEFNIFLNRREGVILSTLNEIGDEQEEGTQTIAEDTGWNYAGWTWKDEPTYPVAWHANGKYAVIKFFRGFATAQERKDLMLQLKTAYPYHDNW